MSLNTRLRRIERLLQKNQEVEIHVSIIIPDGPEHVILRQQGQSDRRLTADEYNEQVGIRRANGILTINISPPESMVK